MKSVITGLSLVGIFGLSIKLAEMHEHNQTKTHYDPALVFEDIILLPCEIPDFPITASQYRKLKPAYNALVSKWYVSWWSPNVHHHASAEEKAWHKQHPHDHHHHGTKGEKVARDVEEFVSFKH
mmetsp:Transcript_80534/g.93957  ORF Transcript_80534/g.93957 Transcript_80534/m.93957 type:complete len:124 (-) Transcript_80534:92-463(-)